MNSKSECKLCETLHSYARQSSSVKVGKYCAIAYKVKIKARTHDPSNATPNRPGPNRRVMEEDMIIVIMSGLVTIHS